MITSTALSQFYGVVLAVTGLGILLNRDHFHKVVDNVCKNQGAQFLLAMLSLLLGTIIVINHNIWHKDWTAIVTIVGWVMLFDGVVRMLFPAAMINMNKAEGKKNSVTALSVIMLIVGLVLVYYGFNL